MEIDNGMTISLPGTFQSGPESGSDCGPREEIQLTRQESVVFINLCTGASNSELAKKLTLSVGTVKFHVSNIREKLGGLSRLQVCLLSALTQTESAELSAGGGAVCRR
ncbi:helix-turn-helix transcriptional regulator [Streptomyces sp. NBC_00335]|uniref:response regulator transcription factor n=1 Tax=unclassified Streptomyces TaxID=2593676 RepID=UPI00225B4692|nr:MULTISPECIES: helix-turn-helix transcriptional regulator [unclassified Streptomyces]MCX5405340.1 helix-turn-helix transcriptional regulator [Streptomyces sp. NBC_00086]